MAHDGEETERKSGIDQHLEAHNHGPGTINQAARDQHIYYQDGIRLTRRTSSGGAPHECPYPGLFPFRPEEAKWFFGRDRLVTGLIGRLDRRQAAGGIQLVLAPSGAGKSSLLGAGLVPRLKQSGLPGSSTWPVVFLTPTAEPLEVLSSRLAAETGTDRVTLLQRLLRGTEDGLDSVVGDLRTLVRAKSSEARLVMIVDQFEELFDACGDESQRSTFLDFLVRTAEGSADRDPLGLVVLGVRAGLYEQLSSRSQLRTALEDSPLIVGPLSEAQLREAIINPALDVGLELEPGLVEVLLGDLGAEAGPGTDAPVQYEAGRLPFLAHALRATYLERAGSTMTIEGYRRTGGIRHAIATTADDIFAGLSQSEKLLAEAMFLRLIKVSGDSDATRRRLPQAELTGSFAEPATATAVMNAFVDARLLTRHQDTVQITHDVLLRSWPELTKWLDENPRGHLVRQEIEEGATAWDRGGQESSRLYRGDALRMALEWATSTAGESVTEEPGHESGMAARYRFELSSTGAQFLDASSRFERRTRTLRRAMTGSVVVLVVIASIAGILAWRANVANQRQQHTQGSHLLGRASRDETEPVRSLQLALAAWHNDPGTQEAYEALLRQYLAMGSLDHIDYDHRDAPKPAGAEASDDGRTDVTMSKISDGRSRLVVRTGLLGTTSNSRTIAEGSLGAYTMSHDGKMVAFVGESGSVNLWTDGGDTERFTVNGSAAPYKTMADNIRFSPDNRHLLLWTRSRPEINPKLPTPLVVLDLPARRIAYEQDKELPPGFDATFGAGSDTVVGVVPAPSTPVFAETQPLPGEVVRIATGEKIRSLPAGARPAENGTTIVTCEWHDTVHVVDVATGVDKYVIPSFPCSEMVLDRSGRYLFGFSDVTGGPYRVGTAVDLATRKHYRFRTPTVPANTAFDVTAAPDRNGDLLIHRAAGNAVLTLRAPEVPARQGTLGPRDPTGRYALRSDNDRTRLVNLTDGAVLGDRPRDFASARFTADGNHVVALRGWDIVVFGTPDLASQRTIRFPAGTPPCESDQLKLLTPQDSELTLLCGPFLYRWSAGTGSELGGPMRFGTQPTVAVFRPGHEHEIVVVQEDVLQIWDVERHIVVKTIPLGINLVDGSVYTAVLDTSGSKIAILLPRDGLALWDLDSAARVAGPIPGAGIGRLLGFGRGDTVIAQGSPDVTVWDFTRGFVSTVRDPSASSLDESLRVDEDTLVVDAATAPWSVTLNPDTWFAELCPAAGRPAASEEITKVSPGALTDLPCA